MLDQTKFAAALTVNVTKSNDTNSVTKVLTIIRVSDWKPTTKGNLPTKMVVTTEGNFFPLASAISNLPSSFPKPIEATAVLTMRQDAQGVDRINMSRLEFTGLDDKLYQTIRNMPVGAALFASAAGFN